MNFFSCYWHFADVPACPPNVRYRGQLGRDMLF